MIAQFNTITGADWARSLVANRARLAQQRIAMADIRRRASEATAARNTFPTMTRGTATQSEEMRKAVETPEAHRESL